MRASLPALFLLTAFIAPSGASAAIIPFASDSSWNALGLGSAQNVCLNQSAPVPCPAGATQYGHQGNGWTADLTAIPDAHWIWAPGVTGSTSPVELSTFTFRKSFVLNETVSAATMFIAADDFASVRVNGSLVGSIGSTTDASLAGVADDTLTLFDIAPFLGIGNNVVEIVGQNGVGSFGGCEECTYAQNPAGVVFGGSITTAPDPDPVPVPPSVWLFGSGLLGLAGIARRRAV